MPKRGGLSPSAIAGGKGRKARRRTGSGLPTWGVKLVYRLAMVAKQPGDYTMTLTVTNGGGHKLRVNGGPPESLD